MKDILILVFTWVIALFLSWAGTCFVVWLIMLCFGVHFTWPIATGVWLIILVLRSIISAAKPDK
jgi:hypothetical protein